MRLLLHGMQNSGATLVALFAGQRKNSVVIADLWTMFCAPTPTWAQDTCVKATFTTSYPLDEHRNAFRPDIVVLVLRRPMDNVASLRRKPYRNHDGTLTEKLAIAEACFLERQSYDGVVFFEDFIRNPELVSSMLANGGWDVPQNARIFRRTAFEMERFTWSVAPHLYDQIQWGYGEARPELLSSPQLKVTMDRDAEALCRKHCPLLHEFYEARVAAEPLTLPMNSKGRLLPDNRANHVDATLRLLGSLLNRRQVDEAIEIAEKLHSEVPDLPSSWLAKAKVLAAQDRPAAAAEFLVDANLEFLGNDDAVVQFSIARGHYLLQAGDVPAAATLAHDLTHEYPKSTGAELLLARVQLREGNSRAALERTTKIVAGMPRNLSVLMLHATALEETGRIKEAVDVLSLCESLEPGRPGLRKRLQKLKCKTTG